MRTELPYKNFGYTGVAKGNVRLWGNAWARMPMSSSTSSEFVASRCRFGRLAGRRDAASLGVAGIADAVRVAARAARAAAPSLASAPDDAIAAALGAMAQALKDAASVVLTANEEDLCAATEGGMSAGLRDRLKLDASRLESMSAQLDIFARVKLEPASREIRELPGGLVLLSGAATKT
jgi:hypothetical protein